MRDPFDVFEDQLTAKLKARRRRRRAPLLAGVAILALSGAATAAAVVVTQEPSKPLQAHVPDSKLSYRVAVRPDLTAGNVGWCFTMVLRQGKQPGGGGNGCGPAGSTERALIGGIGIGGPKKGVTALVLDGKAAAVKVGKRRIVTRTDPAVPDGWKIAVYSNSGGLPVALDAQGRRLPGEDPPGSWAAGRHRYPVHSVDADHPPDAPCAIRAKTLPHLRATTANLLTAFPATPPPDVRQPAFLSCATTVYYLGKTRLRAAVLVDATDHTKQAPELPPNFQLSTRRVQQGWLVLFGGTEKQRTQVLAVLSTTL